MVKQEKMLEVRERAKRLAEERILDYLVPQQLSFGMRGMLDTSKREEIREKLRRGDMDDKIVEVDAQDIKAQVSAVSEQMAQAEQALKSATANYEAVSKSSILYTTIHLFTSSIKPAPKRRAA